jgi:hypothetical protein
MCPQQALQLGDCRSARIGNQFATLGIPPNYPRLSLAISLLTSQFLILFTISPHWFLSGKIGERDDRVGVLMVRAYVMAV